MDEEELLGKLNEQLAYWQKVLFLQDWTVGIKICRQWEMSDTDTLAQCQWFLQRKDAIISVLSPHDLLGLKNRFLFGEEADYDISLVHELLHLHFAPFQREGDEIGIEQAINGISRGMVKLWKGEKEKDSESPPSVIVGGYV